MAKEPELDPWIKMALSFLRFEALAYAWFGAVALIGMPFFCESCSSGKEAIHLGARYCVGFLCVGPLNYWLARFSLKNGFEPGTALIALMRITLVASLWLLYAWSYARTGAGIIPNPDVPQFFKDYQFFMIF